jgi:hypothetical protein
VSLVRVEKRGYDSETGLMTRMHRLGCCRPTDRR